MTSKILGTREDFDIWAGATLIVQATVKSSSGAAQDLTGWTASIVGDSGAVATIPAPTTGQVIMTLTAVQTAALADATNDYKLWIADPDGTVVPVLYGKIAVKP